MSIHLTVPDRAALVDLATRRAFARNYPATIQAFGRKQAARQVEGLVHDNFHLGRIFCAEVRAEFAKVAQ